jgi:hypothetical protein
MGDIQKIYDLATTVLDNNIDYRNCKVDYILEDPSNHNMYLLASDDNELAIEFSLKNGKLDYNYVPEWDYNFDYYLYNYFEEGYKIAYMTDNLHQGLWNSIHELYPKDIEFIDGVKYYVDYCKSHSINKYGLDKTTGLDTPDIMPMFKEKNKDDIER